MCNYTTNVSMETYIRFLNLVLISEAEMLQPIWSIKKSVILRIMTLFVYFEDICGSHGDQVNTGRRSGFSSDRIL